MKAKNLIPPDLREKSWMSKEAGSFSQTPQRTVQLWTERRAVVPRDDTSGTGDRRKYSAINCIQIGIIKALAILRIPFKQIKSVMEKLNDGWLNRALAHDEAFLGVQIDFDKVVKGPQYFILCYNYDEKIRDEEIARWASNTTSGSCDTTLIVNINRIARNVISKME
jgi:DNA-binding transcriptional MerR regulator